MASCSEVQAKSLHLQLEQSVAAAKHHHSTTQNSSSASSSTDKTRPSKPSRSSRAKRPPRPSPYPSTATATTLPQSTTKLTHPNHAISNNDNANLSTNSCIIKSGYSYRDSSQALPPSTVYLQGVVNGSGSDNGALVFPYERYAYCAEMVPRNIYPYQYAYASECRNATEAASSAAAQYPQARTVPSDATYLGYLASPTSTLSPALHPADHSPPGNLCSAPGMLRLHGLSSYSTTCSSQDYSPYGGYVGMATRSDSGIHSSSSPSSPPSYIAESVTPSSSRPSISYLHCADAAQSGVAASEVKQAPGTVQPIAIESGPRGGGTGGGMGLLSSCARQNHRQLSNSPADEIRSLGSSCSLGAIASSVDGWAEAGSNGAASHSDDLILHGTSSVIVRRRSPAAATTVALMQNGDNCASSVTPQYTTTDYSSCWRGSEATGATATFKSSAEPNTRWREDSSSCYMRAKTVDNDVNTSAKMASTSAAKLAACSYDVIERRSSVESEKPPTYMLNAPVQPGYTSVIVDAPVAIGGTYVR